MYCIVLCCGCLKLEPNLAHKLRAKRRPRLGHGSGAGSVPKLGLVEQAEAQAQAYNQTHSDADAGVAFCRIVLY